MRTNNNSEKQLQEKRLFTAKLSQLSFSDLESLKRLKSEEVAEMVRKVIDDQDKMDFWDELAIFNTTIDQVIARKISEIESNDEYYSN